jgi:peptidoglycan hydrolase-like protein with peptidoglycan-binding domain
VKRTLAAATQLVCEVQAALCHLNYLPLLAKIDGILDTRTVYAIKAFQKDHSHTAPDGNIDIGTFPI